MKLPLPVFAVLVAGPFALLAAPRQARREVGLAVALPAVALVAFTMFIPRDTGIRYLLPVLALVIVVASSVVLFARRVGRVVLAVLLAAGAVMAAGSFPHSLAWTTPPFTPGYRFASGSNVDWGQDFYLLRRWISRADTRSSSPTWRGGLGRWRCRARGPCPAPPPPGLPDGSRCRPS